MAVERQPPPWFHHIHQALVDGWRHCVPCERFDVKCALDDDTGEWRIVAAPVLQEIFGGFEDGEQIWTPFAFDATDLLVGGLFGVPGLRIENVAVTSGNHDRTYTPMLVVRGRCDGDPVSIRVFLEPPAGAEPVEVIDTLRNVIRERPRTSGAGGRPA